MFLLLKGAYCHKLKPTPQGLPSSQAVTQGAFLPRRQVVVPRGAQEGLLCPEVVLRPASAPSRHPHFLQAQMKNKHSRHFPCRPQRSAALGCVHAGPRHRWRNSLASDGWL